MKLLAKMTYKLLVTSMIAITLSFFVVTSYAQANRFQDLLTEDGFYYTGTQEGNLTVKEGMFEKIINALSEIASYLLGIMGLAIRGVGIGWIEIAEMILTSILDSENGFFDVAMDSLNNYSQNVVNVETIIFNKVEILNANIFEEIDTDSAKSNAEEEIDKNPNLTEEEKEKQKKEQKQKIAGNGKIAVAIRVAVAKWYYILRLISIAFMLVLLIFIGIKMALSTIASEKAVYKQMLVDWVVGMILVFSIHYIMLAIFAINDSVVDAIEPMLSEKQELPEEYEYGLESSLTTEEIETTLYESARTRAYSLSLVDGFTGMVIYGVLVYYAWRFAIMYIIRVFNIMILTLVAPVIAASYAINKVVTGKSKIFSGWFSEYIMVVIIQIFHAIIYVSFVSMALQFSMESLPGVIVAFVLLNFMLKADKMLRSMFKLVGSQGSLAGDMENIGFKEIQNKAKSFSNAVVGGKLGKEAMKLTYSLATKPARVAIEKGFGAVMEHKANKKEEKEIEELNEMSRLERAVQDLEEKEIEKKKAKVVAKRLELEEERKRVMNQRKGKKRDQALSYVARRQKANDDELEKLEEQLEKLEDARDELEYRQELKKIKGLEKEFAKATFKGNIKDLFFKPDNYVEKGNRRHLKAKRDKNGNFVRDGNGKKIYVYDDGKYHRIKTLREGGASWAVWRKKKNSVGMKFMKNLKLAKLFGLSAESEKELKKEFNFWKTSILGVATSIIGWPALVMNPTLGLALLGNATTAKLNFATRIRQVKNRPSYKKDKNYKFNAFSAGAQYQMQLEAERQIREAQSKMTRRIAKRHPKLAEKIINNRPIKYKTHMNLRRRIHRYFNRPSGISVIQQERMLEITQKEFRKRFKDELKELNTMETQYIADKYRDKFAEEEKAQKEKVEKETIKKLAFENKAVDPDVVQVGEILFGVDIKDDAQQSQEELLEKVEKIEKEVDMPRAERIRKMKHEIKQKKEDLIENQITKYFTDRGVVDISNTNMSDEDVVQIKENLIGVLEEKGIIKKGEIKLEDNLISSENVKTVYQKMSDSAQETNQKLEQRMASKVCLEYMQNNNIQHVTQLQNDEAKDGIYDMIKDKMMSEDSKKSAEVILKISGQDKKKQEIKLSDFMKQAVQSAVEKVQKVEVQEENEEKQKLVQRETNRRMNQLKARLEEAICTDSSDNIVNQKQLEMLFLLSELTQKNVQAERLGQKPKKVTKQMRRKIESYQGAGEVPINSMRDGSRRVETNRDGSRRWNPNRDGSQKVVDQMKVDGLAKLLYGPSQDIIELINQV